MTKAFGRPPASDGWLRRLASEDFRALAAGRRAAGTEGSDGRPAGDIERTVWGIIEDVRRNGDAAVAALTERLDGLSLPPAAWRVTPEEIDAAAARCPSDVRSALDQAAANLEAFHRHQRPSSWLDPIETPSGRLIRGELVRPVATAGLYVPGGTALYPSAVLMNAIPARIAGVGRLVMCTPPSRDAALPPPVMAAARLGGVKEIYRVGGAQAIAAMAFGTETIPRVDRIVGPGNVYVTTAKRLLAYRVGIDAEAGPSEILIVADGTANPVFVAADLLAQVEHDPASKAVLISLSPELSLRVAAELERRLAALPRRSVARAALAGHGALVEVDGLDEALELANLYAPEHLHLMVAKPFELLPAVTQAGAVFLGPWASAVFGDYLAGTNHVLPTGGTARWNSGLGVGTFLKRLEVLWLDERQAGDWSSAVACLARAEGLTGHADAAAARGEGAAGPAGANLPRAATRAGPAGRDLARPRKDDRR